MVLKCTIEKSDNWQFCRRLCYDGGLPDDSAAVPRLATRTDALYRLYRSVRQCLLCLQSVWTPIAVIVLRKHFVCSSRWAETSVVTQKPPLTASRVLSPWMTWIINSLVVLQLFWDLCDVIFMSSSLICCWMSAQRASAGGRIHPPLDWTAESCCVKLQLQETLHTFTQHPPAELTLQFTAKWLHPVLLPSGYRRLMSFKMTDGTCLKESCFIWAISPFNGFQHICQLSALNFKSRQ